MADKAEAAADSLIGKEPNEESFADVAAIAQSACSPITDMRGTAEHRLHLVGVMVCRALRLAHSRISS